MAHDAIIDLCQEILQMTPPSFVSCPESVGGWWEHFRNSKKRWDFLKLRRCQYWFRPDVSIGFIMEHLLEKVSLQVGKLLIGQTGPHFRHPVAFKLLCLFVSLFVCLSPMQSESQVGARCRDSDKERTFTHRELPTCRCNAWQCNAMMPTCCCNVWQCNAMLPSFRCNAWQCNAMLPPCVAFQGWWRWRWW